MKIGMLQPLRGFLSSSYQWSLFITWLANNLILETHPEILLPKATASINLDWVSPKIVPEARIQVQMVYLESNSKKDLDKCEK